MSGRRLPDGQWVHRVRRANARWDGAWPEIVPFVDVEIVPATPEDRGPVVEVQLKPDPMDRLRRARLAKAAACEELTAAWYAADCPPDGVE